MRRVSSEIIKTEESAQKLPELSFDDIDTIQQKTEYVKSMGLGGAMIWALDLDDFKGSCGTGETYPLLKTINRGLGKLHDGKTSNKHVLQSRR